MDKKYDQDVPVDDIEELEVSGQMFDDLKKGIFYAKQKRSGYSIKFIGESK